MKKITVWLIVVVLCLSLFAVALASVSDMDIHVSFRNIKVLFNGENVKTNFEPFIFDGHVYVSLKDIAKIFNVPVSWDSDNNTVILGSPYKSYYTLSEIPFEEEKLEEQEDGSFINVGSSYNETLSGIRFATLKGKVFKDSLVFGGIQNEYFIFDLNKQFSTFTFTAGATDDSFASDKDDFAVIKVYGDSELIYTSLPLKPNGEAVLMSLDVKNYDKLKIEKELHGNSIIKVGVVNSSLKIKQEE